MPVYLPPRLGLEHSEAIAEAYASSIAGDPVMLCLEIMHPDFPEPVRIVNDFRNFYATLEADAPIDAGLEVLFIPVPFRYIKPEQTADGSGAPAAVAVEIDNVSRQLAELMLLARECNSAVSVIEREYLPSDTTAPHVLPVTRLTLSNIVLTVDVVRANLSFGDLTNRKFPALTYTAEAFPGLAAT